MPAKEKESQAHQSARFVLDAIFWFFLSGINFDRQAASACRFCFYLTGF
jgi:hypothetical protein